MKYDIFGYYGVGLSLRIFNLQYNESIYMSTVLAKLGIFNVSLSSLCSHR
jgi:hypothetical protein